jgi:hypothetical protein
MSSTVLEEAKHSLFCKMIAPCMLLEHKEKNPNFILSLEEINTIDGMLDNVDLTLPEDKFKDASLATQLFYSLFPINYDTGLRKTCLDLLRKSIEIMKNPKQYEPKKIKEAFTNLTLFLLDSNKKLAPIYKGPGTKKFPI